MVRLPLIKMCSRETNRLPAAEVNKILHTSGLPLELIDMPEPSKKFFIYHQDPLEVGGRPYHEFKLVEVIGEYEERILLASLATGISFNSGSQYCSFHAIETDEIGNYKFYFPYFERKRN